MVLVLVEVEVEITASFACSKSSVVAVGDD
jgi:hypothetical protein